MYRSGMTMSTIMVWSQMFSFVIDTSLSLLRMIYSGVFDRFPKLKLVMPHAGGILPYLDGRLSYTPPDYRRFVPQDRKRPPEYLRSDNIWYDISNPSVAVLKMIKDYAGTERLMFGSDYPSVEHQYLIDLIGQIGFSKSELENIKWKKRGKALWTTVINSLKNNLPQDRIIHLAAYYFLVSLAGLEPATHSLEGCCSIHLSYRTHL